MFILTVESSACAYEGSDSGRTLAASVNFVDLAGSERASQTLAAGTRLKEGSHINRSLLTLGTVIRKLSEGGKSHIPYRNSKLTRILQNSLGGNARTAIVCTMSPAHSHVDQSRNTLLFASCAKDVSTNAQVNVVISDKALVKQLQQELARLANELKLPPGSNDSAALIKEMELQIEKVKSSRLRLHDSMGKEIEELTQQRDRAESRLDYLIRVTGTDPNSLPWVGFFFHRVKCHFRP
ncbi:putative plus-end-directed kinesin ATPase [Helianthus annuus]|nr:putative plus-end-directed kinesin ATPase [Helianthus annuus]KAJ0639497.1 putative plus-end-directed kinesin ATPase [Helianthus annuus]